MARFDANVAALRLVRVLAAERRPANRAEQGVLEAWSGWGAAGLADVFDERSDQHARRRAVLRELLAPGEYAAARRTTLNAHYTAPRIAAAVWDGVVGLGFTAGEVLEPGCGAGVFLGLAPAGARVTGVELDPVTAEIAAALYPQATVRTESFADTRLPVGSFDLAVGNVPFADVVLHDPVHNPGRYSLHNHFILKSLGLVRPGGLVAVLTSRWTMDAQNPAARRAIGEGADLVAALRLPSGAHERTAGTDAVTDLLILRRRFRHEAPLPQSWATTVELEVAGVEGRGSEFLGVNRYWLEHPQHVVGEHRWRPGPFGPGLFVQPDDLDRLAGDLGDRLAGIVADARARGLGWVPRASEPDAAASEPRSAAPADLLDGCLVADTTGFSVVEDGTLTPLTIPRTQVAELGALLALRDAARTLVATEAASFEDTTALAALRGEVAHGWRDYVARWGPINRFTLRPTGKTDPETGEAVQAQLVPPAVRTLLRDPFGPLVAALEVFDPVTQKAEPAALLRCRQVVPREPVRGVDTAGDGLAVVLDARGWPDVDAIADLMGGVAVERVVTELGDQIFRVPPASDDFDADRPWVTRAAYLSGHVRGKLAAARRANLAEPGRWDAHVAALEAVLPADIPAGDITASPGAVWIPATDHQEFLRHLLDSRYPTVHRVAGSSWEVRGGDHGVRATREWGTERLPAGSLLKKVMEQAPIAVFDTIRGGRGERDQRVLNRVETDAAIEKAERLVARFGAWVWEDPERAGRLVEEYNRLFNSVVLRDYGDDGARLTLPGLAADFTPMTHQRAAVARMIAEPCVGLFHEVGAGKTAEIVLGLTELKRLGLIRKPAVVVPNHMLEQFAREWLQLYPQARLLAAGVDDLAEGQRRRFVARVATNDWDAVVLTRTAFQRLSLSPANEAAFREREVEQQRAALTRAQADGARGPSLKAMERLVARVEEELKRARDLPVDPGVTFEESGIDYLVVDELHDYKNLATASRIQGSAISGSKQAMDLFAKIEYLRHANGPRVFTGATATPIANSITEMFVMQRYHGPDSLRELGIVDFDTWAATFGTVVTAPEVRTQGEGFKMKSRLARFNNVPELVALFNRFADVKTADDLDLPRPALARRPSDGARQPHLMLVPRTATQAEFMGRIAERADLIEARRVDPADDNMLKLSSHARLGSLDLRLVDPVAYAGSDAGGKIDAAADVLAGVWADTRDHEYLDRGTGEVSPHRGALQLVFCDLGVPGKPVVDQPSWDVYTALRDALVVRGLPAERIRFIHEARTDRDKARLFAACRNGHVSILIGSTAKMGTGVNIQDRVVHLLHLNAPWRPADLTQRNGRGLRQGNQNPEVMITQVIAEQTFDTYSWQTLERKAVFIGQVMNNRAGARETGDVGDDAFTFAEAKAIGSGNPTLIELAEANLELGRLTRLQTAHQRTERGLAATLSNGHAELARLAAEEQQLRRAASLARPRGDTFSLEVADTVGPLHACTERGEAVVRLNRITPSTVNRPRTVARVDGLDVVAELRPGRDWGEQVMVFSLDAAPSITTTVLWGRGPKPVDLGVITRLENLPGRIPRRLEQLALRAQEVQLNVRNAGALQGQPFTHTDALVAARDRYQRLAAEVADAGTAPTYETVAPRGTQPRTPPPLTPARGRTPPR